MANREGLIGWALANSEKMGLRVTQFRWTDIWLPGLVDLEVSVRIDQRKFTGRGTAFSEILALEKALGEAIESAILYFNRQPHSNGMAVHQNEELARRKAVLEIFERDGFFTHFLAGKPFYQLPVDFAPPAWYSGLIERLQLEGIALRAFEATRRGCIFTVVCVGNGTLAKEPFGLVIGLGCDTDLLAAFQSAVLECIRTVTAAMQPGSGLVCREVDCECESWVRSPMHHLRFALHPFYPSRMPLFQSEGLPPQVGPMRAIEFDGSWPSVRRLKAGQPLLDSAPVTAFKAEAPHFQDLFFGPTTWQKVNLPRLASLMGRPVDFSELSRTLHPLG